jgi:hypothetical protein
MLVEPVLNGFENKALALERALVKEKPAVAGCCSAPGHAHSSDASARLDALVADSAVRVERTRIAIGAVEIKRGAYWLLIVGVSGEHSARANAVDAARGFQTMAADLTVGIEGASQARAH